MLNLEKTVALIKAISESDLDYESALEVAKFLAPRLIDHHRREWFISECVLDQSENDE